MFTVQLIELPGKFQQNQEFTIAQRCSRL